MHINTHHTSNKVPDIGQHWGDWKYIIVHVGTYKVCCFLQDAILKQKPNIEQKTIENRLKLLNGSVEGETYFLAFLLGLPQFS